MERESNEQKAKTLVDGLGIIYTDCNRVTINKLLMKMADWKDEQFAKEKQRWIERVLTILTNWAKKHTKECDGDKFMRMGLTNDLVIYFKQAMKGE